MKYLIGLLQKAESRGVLDDAFNLLKETGEEIHPVKFNNLVYLVYDAVSNAFIDQLPKELQERAGNSKSIFCNFIDSRLRFTDDEVQELWEKSDLYM